MSQHTAIIRWQLSNGDFLARKYSREHTWTFDGGVTVPASPSPSVVPAPRIVYGSGKAPSAEEEDQLHHEAHETCFIANSIKTEVSVIRP